MCVPPVRSLPFTERVEEIHQAADIFVSASRSEGFGNGLVEGLASGCVAVGTLVEGQREIFEGLPGCRSVPVEDPVAIADAVESLLAQRERWPELGEATEPTSSATTSCATGLAGWRTCTTSWRRRDDGPARVLTMIDSLVAGGAERVAVEIACGLDRDRFTPHVVVTRHGGPLEAPLRAAGVQLTVLDRTGRLPRRAPTDLGAGSPVGPHPFPQVSELRVGRAARTCRPGAAGHP